MSSPSFDRFREQVILTWQGSEDTFHKFNEKSSDNVEHTQNEVAMSIGSTVHFHDIEISYNNNNGVLESKVYYDQNIDVLCNIFDEQIENKSKQLYAVLYRAVRCCSDIMKYIHERNRIKVSFLINAFPPKFIDSGIQHFYLEFCLSRYSFSGLLNEQEYQDFRQHITEDTELQMELKKAA